MLYLVSRSVQKVVKFSGKENMRKDNCAPWPPIEDLRFIKTIDSKCEPKTLLKCLKSSKWLHEPNDTAIVSVQTFPLIRRTLRKNKLWEIFSLWTLGSLKQWHIVQLPLANVKQYRRINYQKLSTILNTICHFVFFIPLLKLQAVTVNLHCMESWNSLL